MTKRWHIRRYKGFDVVWERWAPGTLSERQIAQILARLQCRHLTEDEVLSFSMRSKGPERTSELVASMNSGDVYMGRFAPEYTARLEAPMPKGLVKRSAQPT